MKTTKIYVPAEIGVCVDDFGFLGILDLQTGRGVHEFLGVVKDRRSKAYLVDFQYNENPGGRDFILKEVERSHPAGLYYVSDYSDFEGIRALESYALYITEDCYCYLTRGAGSCLPEVRTATRRWKHRYEVVRDVK